jgi:hypothetical protein
MLGHSQRIARRSSPHREVIQQLVNLAKRMHESEGFIRSGEEADCRERFFG